MSQARGGRRNRYYNRNNATFGEKGMEVLKNLNEESLVVQQFRAYAAELDSKHDRFERIVKFGRDIRIESKRIIFLLHTLDTESKRESLLNEVKVRLDNLAKSLFKSIAYELDGNDPYQYHKAYQAGLEEYVEAVTFFQYIQDGNLEDWTHLEKTLSCAVLDNSDSVAQDGTSPTKIIKTLVPPQDYVMGAADLTGELMRKCINNLAIGDIASCYDTCNFVRNMHKGFLGCSIGFSREMNRKLYTLRQSLCKMENVCYTIKIRGSEIPKYLLADAALAVTEKYPAEEDEDYHMY